MILKNGVELVFEDVGNDLYQPVVSFGNRKRIIPLLLEKQQLGKAEELISKIDDVSNFEFYIMMVMGGIRIAMMH